MDTFFCGAVLRGLRKALHVFLSEATTCMPDFLSGYSAHAIYALLFVFLLLSGTGFPTSEELFLLMGGVLVASGVLQPLPMFFSTFLGILSGDILLFWLGRGLLTGMNRFTFLTRWVSPQKLAKARPLFAARRGSTTVFIARFLPGLRAPAFLLAGTMEMPFWRFICVDILACLIFIPLLCFLGYLFADQVDTIVLWFRHAERALLTLVVVLVLGWLAWRRWGKRTRGDAPPAARVVDHR